MSDQQREALARPFGPEMIRQKKGQGGRTMDYVSHGGITKRLNDVAPDWSTTMVERYIQEQNGALHCLGGVMRLTIGGVTREEAGGPARLGTLADDLKNTYSDCLKRCAMRFGVALDLWESAEEADEDAQPDQTAPDAPGGAGSAASDTTANAAFEAVLTKAWKLAEAKRPVAAVKDWLNAHRHAMDKEQRRLAMAELAKIEAAYYADAVPAERQTAGV